MNILDVVVDIYGDKMTIKEFFKECMVALWEEGVGFSGKRPICDSGWEGCIMEGLCEAGIIKGERDNDGWNYSDKEATKAVKLLSEALMEL